jgi:hypothetical protein
MSREVWGTCAVNDHRNAALLLRSLLLFDRLVIPYPANQEERKRWQRPNPADPTETWDPDSLDSLLSVLGTQDSPGRNGARLVWTSPWSQHRWQTSKREMADLVTTFDAFWTTRQILATGRDLPGVVEAVALYPSREAWQQENRPTAEPPEDARGATALVALARPLLLPDAGRGDDRHLLEEVVDLAADPDFCRARTAYHDWLREFVAPLQVDGSALAATVIDEPSLRLAKERLEHLLDEEQRIVKRGTRRRRWKVKEAVMMVVGTAASVGLAIAVPPAAPAALGLAILGPGASFAGWIAGTRAKTPEPQPLNGASMFLMAKHALD